MTGILKQLKWESLKKRRKDSRLIMLYKGLKGAASIPTNDLVPPIRCTRNHHLLAFQIPMAGTDIYKSSFFPQTIRDWNLLADSSAGNGRSPGRQMRPKIIWGDLIWSEIRVFVARRIMFGRPTLNLCMPSNNRVMSVQTGLYQFAIHFMI